jgi:trans-aconitate methyltransferase
MMALKRVSIAATIVATMVMCGCGDQNADNTVAKPPPADAVTGTKGPQEMAAEAKANRNGLHKRNAEAEANGGSLGDGK